MKRPEVSWSIMHPIRVDPGYMQTVIAAAARYRVDSFEVCGDCHSWTGGVEGAIYFRDYPAAAARLNRPGIAQNIARLNAAIELAHASGRPVYYWHREVMVPRPVVEAVPGLLDERGEFNLLGEAYHTLLRSKLREFFDHVPALDGLVLTLTESDYSVIHNSDPERYPPGEVIRSVIATFAGELKRQQKRFILRSFGSVAQDYEDILAGAEQAGADHAFEIETKITPYDFSPFLPFNPYLRRTPGTNLSAEYDSIGEFLGAGFLPAADPQRAIDSVRYAQAQGVDRHTIRIDRIGHPVFASTQAINLLAFDRAIHEPATTARDVWAAWAAERWPEAPAEMTALMRRGIEMVKKTHFIDGHVIFHAFPIQPELKWIKSCGILSVFSPGADLTRHRGMWGILGDRLSPASRAEILWEKDEAVRIADEGLGALRKLEGRLAAAEFGLAETAWRNAATIARWIRAWCAGVAAYFDDMEKALDDCPALHRVMAAARPDFPNAGAAGRAGARPKSGDHEYGDHASAEDNIVAAYARPIWQHLERLTEEYGVELAERRHWQALPGLVDMIVCGGLTDDHRVRRYMHASHSQIETRPSRIVGNRVFPNGFIECRLRAPHAAGLRLRIEGDATESCGFRLNVNGVEVDAAYDGNGAFELPVPPAAGEPPGPVGVTVRIQKAGTDYPWIHGVALIRDPARTGQ